MNEIVEWAMSLAENGGAAALIALALATLLTEDLTCIAAGLLVAQGKLGFWEATAACYVGILCGDLLLVLMGRTVGRKSLRVAPLKWWLSEELVVRAERWFTRRGPGIVFASRFMPGTRVPTYFAAGVLRAPFMRFAAWFALACAIWVPLLVGTATWLGTRATEMLATWTSAVPALLAAGLLAWLVAQLGLGMATWRGRRLLLGRWRRLTRFALWPRWAVLAPAALWGAWRSLWHRRRGLLDLANAGASPVAHDPARRPADGTGAVFAVSWHRWPGAAAGEIFCLAEKHPARVTGDGRRCLEDLILADDTTVGGAPHFLRQLGARLDDVPAAGERVMLEPVGAAGRWARCEARPELATPALRAELGRLLGAVTGFHCGTCEVRAESDAALARGEFALIGLEGPAAEPAALRDPRHTAWRGWRMACRHRIVACRMAAANLACGRG